MAQQTTQTAIAPEVLWEVDDGVAIITLNAPETRNAQTATMERDVCDLLTRADEDPAVRAVVFTGNGTHFCVGAGMSYIDSFAAQNADNASIPHPLATYAMGVRKPVISALNGPAAGIGMVWAMSCDVRYAVDTVKFSTAFARRGLVAERTMGWLLPRVVGLGAAMDLALSARAVGAEEALKIGLVNKLLPRDGLLAGALAWAHDVAHNCSPAAMAQIKTQLHRSYNADLPAALAESSSMAMHAFRSGDVNEGVASFVEKRNPAFPSLGSDYVAPFAIRGPETL